MRREVCFGLAACGPQNRAIRGSFSKNNPNFPRYIVPDFLQYLCEGKNKPTKP
jgi:hypothetical protein